MDNSLKKSIIVGIFLFVIISFLYVYEYSQTKQPQRTFSVSAEGKEVVIPNIAELTIGLINDGSDLAKLQQENADKFNRIINFLKNQGIADKDVKTGNYSISPKYRYDKVTEIVGYTISQNVSVKIRDLKNIGEILNGVVQNGANNIYGLNFIVDDEKSYLDRAREKAIEEAKGKARKIAETAGFKLGKIINITESSGYFPPYSYYSVFSEKVGSGGELSVQPKIESGSQEIKISVTITYEIR